MQKGSKSSGDSLTVEKFVKHVSQLQLAEQVIIQQWRMAIGPVILIILGKENSVVVIKSPLWPRQVENTRPSKPTMHPWLPWFSLIYIIDRFIYLFIYLPIYLFTYLFIYLFIFIYLFVFIYLFLFIYFYLFIFIYIYLLIFIYLIYSYLFIHIYLFIFVYSYLFIHIYLYLFIYSYLFNY